MGTARKKRKGNWIKDLKEMCEKKPRKYLKQESRLDDVNKDSCEVGIGLEGVERNRETSSNQKEKTNQLYNRSVQHAAEIIFTEKICTPEKDQRVTTLILQNVTEYEHWY